MSRSSVEFTRALSQMRYYRAMWAFSQWGSIRCSRARRMFAQAQAAAIGWASR